VASFEGRRLLDIEGLREFGEDVQAQFDSFLVTQAEHGQDHWQKSFELGKMTAEQLGRQA
jgi:hypothetical protein